MQNKLAYGTLAIFSIMCLIGACTIYVIDFEHTASLESDSNGNVILELDGFLPQEYAYMVLTGVHTFDSIYFYYDEDYASTVSTSKVIMFRDTLSQMLDLRGYAGFESVDANGLKDVLSDTMNASDVAVLATTGALPDTVQDENGYSLLTTWLSAGGTMYWMGGNPCETYAAGSNLIRLNEGMFDSSWFNTDVSDEGATDCSYIAEEFQFGYTAISNAIVKDAPGSRVLGLTDDRYSSFSMMPAYGGSVYLFGGMPGTLSFEQCSAFADMLVCGVTADTKVVEKSGGHKGYGDMAITIEPDVSGELLFVKVGKPITNYGAVVRL